MITCDFENTSLVYVPIKSMIITKYCIMISLQDVKFSIYMTPNIFEFII